MGKLGIKYDERNYRKHGDTNKRLIKKSLEECGAGRSIVLDNENVIIAGNGVYEQATELGLKVRIVESDGTEIFAIKRTDLSTKDERRKLLAMADNRTSDTSEFDIDLLTSDFDIDLLNDWDFSSIDLGIEINDEQPANHDGTLAERFINPPFSVLDTRSSRWQERRNAWLALGIRSEVGRADALAFSKSAQSMHVYCVKNKLREERGKEPSWDEVIEYCKSNGVPVMAGTSIFDPVLCELVYRWFNVEEGHVLDPFAGGSVRGIVAAKLGMRYCGMDLREEQVEANYKNATDVLGKGHFPVPAWHIGDSRTIDETCRLLNHFPFDLLFSCPPYADLEVYSDDPRDLSNMDYQGFISAYREIIRKSCDLLKDNRFAVFVVGEVRGKNGAYRNFVSDTIDAFRSAGLHYYNEIILVNQTCSLPIRAARCFNNGRKIGKHHQNVLAFYKGDIKKIKEYYPEIDFSDDDLFNCEEND